MSRFRSEIHHTGKHEIEAEMEDDAQAEETIKELQARIAAARSHYEAELPDPNQLINDGAEALQEALEGDS